LPFNRQDCGALLSRETILWVQGPLPKGLYGGIEKSTQDKNNWLFRGKQIMNNYDDTNSGKKKCGVDSFPAHTITTKSICMQ
jgi:hypothetical protein